MNERIAAVPIAVSPSSEPNSEASSSNRARIVSASRVAMAATNPLMTSSAMRAARGSRLMSYIHARLVWPAAERHGSAARIARQHDAVVEGAGLDELQRDALAVREQA